jgi:hypothetical protein
LNTAEDTHKTMTESEEYRFNAEECERMAENSLNPKDKAAWLRLAKRWLGMTTPGTSSERSEADSLSPESRRRQRARALRASDGAK